MKVFSNMSWVGVLLGSLFFIALTLTIVLCRALPAHAATITVTNALDDNSAGSLRQLVSSANAGDTITFAPGYFNSARTITLTRQIVITKSLTIDGSSASITPTISGGNITRTFYTTAGTFVTLNHISIINGNAAINNGGGIYNAGVLNVSHSSFISNSATALSGIDDGGAIYNAGTLTVSHSVFISNTANYGGGIRNNGTATVSDSSFYRNRSLSSGGAVMNGGTFALNINANLSSADVIMPYPRIPDSISGSPVMTMKIIHSTFTDNAAAYGAGVWSDSTLTLIDSEFSHNAAIVSGGALFNGFSIATLSNSTIYSNTAQFGGGIYNASGPLTVTNATIVTNSATIEGGAIMNEGLITATNVTFAGNISSLGSTVAVTGTAVIMKLVMRNTIVLYAAGQDGCYGNVVDGGYNLESGITCNLTATHSLQNSNPLLAALKINMPGINVSTMALLSGSPAINTGNNAVCPSTDERGIPRMVNNVCDIGAFEFWSATYTAYLPLMLR